MPIFDFICEACHEEFEALVLGNKLACCPKCRSKNLKKKMSSFAVGGRGKSSNSSSGSQCGGCAGGSCSTCH
jgi:putative FmdB family regulatory protein